MDTQGAAVVTYRDAEIENVHHAHIAVVDAHGKLLYSFGDPTRMTLARSAAKPAQALAVLEAGAFEQFAFDDADLALMCASHSSEDRHIERARSMLDKVQAQESDLRCGGHAPLSDAVYRSWVKRDFTPSAACSNCSGKHVGMLGGARALGAALDGYHLPDHPIQQQVKRVVAQLCGLPDDRVQWGIDGCNLPTPAFPLDRLAFVYAQLAHAPDAADEGKTQRAAALARMYRAMTGYPELVAGEGRYCTLLMRAFEGQVVGKLGADACYGVGVRASAHTERLGTQGAVGISVKVADGNVGVVYMIVSEILERLRLGTPGQRSQLTAFHRPKMLNTQGVEFGHAEFPFELTKH
ncbi:asparaginase [Paraburkholderia sp. MPAMCS5]|uniref:asparaginase n=1 Tax=Paraburkholderia sp. MPAMCS5 TaxID=3112563 RepID=UPI002E19F57A|nr:asparaginase [Paraburkholderia sp. MPAMCS5]